MIFCMRMRVLIASSIVLAATAWGAPTDLPTPFVDGVFYSRHNTAEDGIWFGPANGSPEIKVTTGGRARLAPDGNLIAFLRGDIVNGSAQVWLQNLTSGLDHPLLAQGRPEVKGLTWSADSSQIIFDNSIGISAADLLGGAVTNLFSIDANDDAPSLRLCDGALVFQNIQSGLWVTGPEAIGRRFVPNTLPGDIWPVWSTDGQWIVFSDQHDLWKIRPDGSARTRLTFLSDPTDSFNNSAAWTPDGRLILAGGRADGQTGLYAVEPNGQGGLALIRTFPPESLAIDIGSITGFGVSRTKLQLGIIQPAAGTQRRVQVFGWPGTQYLLEASADLLSWSRLDTNVVSASSFGYSIEETGASYQFYRASVSVTVNVTQHHNQSTRDGVYTDPLWTLEAAASLRRDTNFDGAIAGNVYAQPLYLENGPGGRAMVIAVTESNNVYALDATTGTIIWQRNVGVPVSLADLPCGNINPLGITGTPVVDLPSRTLLFDAMTTPDNGLTKRHLIYSLDVDTGTNHLGWPVDVNATARSGTTAFNSSTQGQRGALAVVSGKVLVPYGGFYGDCGKFYGWLVNVPLDNPGCVEAWVTPGVGGGAWGVGGVASDGLHPFIATGNTFGASVWSGGEAIIRFPSGPLLHRLADYWAPTNWVKLDNADIDIGGSGPLLVDVPGATPSQLVVSLGKDGNAYLLDRMNLGGISQPVAAKAVSTSPIIQSAATYRTTKGTYVVFSGQGVGCPGAKGDLAAFLITPTGPPTMTMAWCAKENGRGSPFVTTTAGLTNTLVWGIGAEGDQRLHGFDGDTGAVVFAGGGGPELMAGTRRFATGIVARGRLFIGADNRVYAFNVPIPPPIILTNTVALSSGAIRFGFTNSPGLSFNVVATTDLALPLVDWTLLGVATEAAAGQFQFTDSQAIHSPQRFYRVRRP